MDNIKVTIIMPSLNVAKYYRDCIESAVNQTLKDIEILCIDAGSTDGTEEIIKDYEKRDSRVCFIHSNIKSYGYQVNLGIESAHGEYIAIIETDDFVEPDMYEKLYDTAKTNQLDIVKADYDKFVTLSNGEKMQETMPLFDNEWDLYNQVVYPREHDRLFCEDYFLWKGIYRREFLIENNIRLNESRGAAFQDIGFMQQVLSYAKRVMYLKESFYRYRVDRDEASTYSPKILRYGWQEFSRLLDMYNNGCDLYLKGLYIHMMRSFRGELYSVLRAKDYQFDSEFIEPYWDWFVEHISKALEQKIVDIEEDYYVSLFDGYDKLATLVDKGTQLKEVRQIALIDEEREAHISSIVSRCEGKDVVIFGAGICGKNYLKWLDGRVHIVAFVDNDYKKQNTLMYGLSVMALEDCLQKYEGCYFVIANSRHSNFIVEQLVSAGCKYECIIVD